MPLSAQDTYIGARDLTPSTMLAEPQAVSNRAQRWRKVAHALSPATAPVKLGQPFAAGTLAGLQNPACQSLATTTWTGPHATRSTREDFLCTAVSITPGCQHHTGVRTYMDICIWRAALLPEAEQIRKEGRRVSNCGTSTRPPHRTGLHHHHRTVPLLLLIRKIY